MRDEAFCSAACYLVLPLIAGADSGSDKRPYEPTENYAVQTVEGWRVLVNKAFQSEHAEVHAQTMRLLATQLYQIDRRVPKAAVKRCAR